jgi:chemotaxis protein CheD
MTGARLIGIGQFAVARAPERLCCLGLGSCVAVFIYDPESRIGGVLHALLPRTPRNSEPNARYADSGIRMLRDELIAKGAEKKRLCAKLVGGAQMFPNLDLKISDIGGENIKEARKVLRIMGIRVLAEEVQGNKGRSAYYSLDSGAVTVKTAFSPDKTI